MLPKTNKLDEVVTVAIILDGEGTANEAEPLPPTVGRARLKIDDDFFLLISFNAYLEIG
jgi:hypothetical protein